MSVYISDFSGPEWLVVHDEAGHSGTLQPTDVTYTTNMDGSLNHSYANVTCPVCGAVSTHPVGGGAQPSLVQQMFVEKVTAEGCVCPDMLERGALSAEDATAHVKELVTAMDGKDRWQLG